MKFAVRGTVCAVALVAALTGCGGDGDAADSAVGVVGIGSGDGKGKKSGPLSVEQVRAALPTNEELGAVWVGDDLAAFEGEMARRQCAKETGTSCDGLVAAGHKEAAVRGNSDDDDVEFTLFSFDSKQAATAAMKGMAAKTGSGDPAPEPTQFTTGADETQSFTNGRSSTRTVMRVGNVVAYVQASIYNTENRNRMSTLQVELIKKAG
ncbi:MULTISPECIES: hypothetical protein [unclassified Streptomyces]|uniref:DUF7373 family lipoprotein n=1 Tax=unclassified Streptomyces TaxID=2593676 RepID=UPI0020308269|nr:MULTISPECIES: hypothetical protein [unclassified Streptomyces]MCM1969033.1 hypothetical protein [Streptomyces sp. G1]MCX5297792.1 hypothetical protein [Streptomyces sp. NBC_00193]